MSIRTLSAGIAAMSVLHTSAAAQQGNLPTPVGKLPPYPPVVCVTPNWTAEACESRQMTEKDRWEWQCGNVNVKVTLSENQAHWPISTEYAVSGIEKSNNRFRYVWGKDALYLNGELCALKTKPIPKEQEETKSQPSAEPAKQAKPKTVLYNEPGGIISDHWKRWQALALSGDDVEIRGACTSACTLIMAHIPNDRLCFGESASLQFHASRNATSGEPSISTTQWMINSYPQDIRRWIIAKGGVEKMTIEQAWTLSAPELWAMGYRRCEAEAPPALMTILRTNRNE
jgi:hypothetical protein